MGGGGVGWRGVGRVRLRLLACLRRWHVRYSQARRPSCGESAGDNVPHACSSFDGAVLLPTVCLLFGDAFDHQP